MSANQKTMFDEPIPVWQGGPQVTPPAPRAEGERRKFQAAKILERLERGPALNTELILIGDRFGARIHDLRDAGHEIQTAYVSPGVYRYSLLRAGSTPGGET